MASLAPVLNILARIMVGFSLVNLVWTVLPAFSVVPLMLAIEDLSFTALILKP